jgi:hypothetical protein
MSGSTETEGDHFQAFSDCLLRRHGVWSQPVSRHLSSLMTDFAHALAGGGLPIDEVRTRTTFMLTNQGNFTSSVFFTGIALSLPCINCRMSSVLEDPGILILDHCTMVSPDVAYGFLALISEFKISILLCMHEFPPDLTGLLIIHQFTVFHNVSEEVCKQLSQLAGLKIFSDIDQISEAETFQFSGHFFALPGDFANVKTNLAPRLLGFLKSNFQFGHGQPTAFFVSKEGFQKGTFAIGGEHSAIYKDVITIMIDYAFHANCLQSFLAVFSDGETAVVRPRFNWFLAASDATVDVFPYSFVFSPLLPFSISQPFYQTFYSPDDLNFLQFLELFFQNVRCDEGASMFTKVAKIDSTIFDMKTEEYLNVFHSQRKMVISGFEKAIIPVDSPPAMVFERAQFPHMVHSVLHENFFLISFGALMELLFYNSFMRAQELEGKSSRITFIWQGKGVNFEIGPLSVLDVVRQSEPPSLVEPSEGEIFSSLLFSAQSIFADALARLRVADLSPHLAQIEQLFANFGAKALSAQADSHSLRIAFFREFARWFDELEGQSPQMKAYRLPDFAGRATSLCRYMVLKFLCFNGYLSLPKVLELMDRFDTAGIPTGKGVPVAWLRAKVTGQSSGSPPFVNNDEMEEAMAVLLSLAGYSYFYPQTPHICPVLLNVTAPTSVLGFVLSSSDFVRMFVQVCPFEEVAIDFMHGKAVDRPFFPDLFHLHSPVFQIQLQEDFRTAYPGYSPRITLELLFPVESCSLMSLFGYSVREIIDSLRKCEQAVHSGGKTGASFFRTRDKRFLVKTISNAEMTFLMAFLPHYFAYMLAEPESYLVHILAAFTITVESEQVNYSHRCILMENLAAGFDDFETYDLKGSARNRWLESATVKLDLNYRRSRIEQRVVLTAPMKDSLMKQIARDSLFLAQHRVMDYSMLAIVAGAAKAVRLGIVDFCRPYTIDKALESMVKKTPLYRDHSLGDPSVISPAEYQRRFVDAMRDYFYVAPSYADTITYLAKSPSTGH